MMVISSKTKQTQQVSLEYISTKMILVYSTHITKGIYSFFFFFFLESKIFKNSLAINLFLHTHTGSSQHSKTSITQFLRLHIVKVLGIFRFQSKWIKLDITGVVCLT